MTSGKVLVYLLRRDLRVSDNPILHHLATTPGHGFTHLLPVYVFPSRQVEISGFLKSEEKSPYPQAVSQVGKFWRCGPHRAKFTAQSVWDLKIGLEEVGSGLILRVGDQADVLKHLIQQLSSSGVQVGAVWMTEELSSEEIEEQDAVSSVCSDVGVEFKLWPDEKYFIDDRDTGLDSSQDLPDVFTTYRKSQEPLREKPRKSFPRPESAQLPLPPPISEIPPQEHPFLMPETLDDLQALLLKPLDKILANPPQVPENALTSHPFNGGETCALERLQHLVKSGAASTYQETRNGLLGADFSTKLSGYLALGCVSARQVHEEMLKFEDGSDVVYKDTKGYGEGENKGTESIRFELLWRDYMRLCTKKFGRKLFRLAGFRQDDNYVKQWKSADKDAAPADQDPSAEEVERILQRFLEGTTGMGLIDASQRELFFTGYTSNRTRQNVASFFAKHLGIDWRYGAEWYEMLLVDYDVSSNWSNWQYVAGVGNDPRGDARIFNPVKQAFDYDVDGAYVRTWVPEIKDLEKRENLFQVWTTNTEELDSLGLTDNVMVTDPIKKIEYLVDRKPRGNRRPFPRRRGPSRGARRGGNSGGDQSSGGDGETSTDGATGHQAGGYQSEAQQTGSYQGEGHERHQAGHQAGHQTGHQSGGHQIRGHQATGHPSHQVGVHQGHFLAGSTPPTYHPMDGPQVVGYASPPLVFAGPPIAAWYHDPNMQHPHAHQHPHQHQHGHAHAHPQQQPQPHGGYYRGGRNYNNRGGFRGRFAPTYVHAAPPVVPVPGPVPAMYVQPYPGPYPPHYPPPPSNMEPPM